MRPLFLLIGLIVIIAGAVYVAFSPQDSGDKEEITSFTECVEAGYAVLESYPRQCRTADGELFVEEVGNEMEKADLIRVSTPRPGENVTSPLSIKGEARGYWFFEATFPIRVHDERGNVLASSFATAQGEWMTEEFVPFEAVVEFGDPVTTQGNLILERSNPSGLAERHDELIIPVSFSSSQERGALPQGECRPTGCSLQICADQEVASTCEWNAGYACYRLATCKRQAGGECGWTMTEESAQCFEHLERDIPLP